MYSKWILICFNYVLFTPVYCVDQQPAVFAYGLMLENNHIECLSVINNNTVKEGQRIQVLVRSRYVINLASFERDPVKSKKDQANGTFTLKTTGPYGKYSPVLDVIANKSYHGLWRISVYILQGIQPKFEPMEVYEKEYYTVAHCEMEIIVTDGSNTELKYLWTWLVFSFLCLLIIVLLALVIYYKHKAMVNRKYAKLSSLEHQRSTNENLDGIVRYSKNPNKKAINTTKIESMRESGIYEALESLQMPRRPLVPEPPHIETLPRTPKPVASKITKEPLPIPPPIQGTTLGPSINSQPTSPSGNLNKPIAPAVTETENTYEPPPNFRGHVPNALPEPEKKTGSSNIFKFRRAKTTVSKHSEKEQEISADNPRSLIERIKVRPQMPIPSELEDTEQNFEDILSTSTASLIQNAQTKVTSSPTSAVFRDVIPNKPTTLKKPIRPKHPAELVEDSLKPIPKFKPATTRKPTKILAVTSPGASKQVTDMFPAKPPPPRNIADPKPNQSNTASSELLNALKKRKDQPGFAANELLSVLKKPKEPPSAPLRRGADPMPEASRQKEMPTPGNEKKYDDEESEWDKEDRYWEFESIENFNIYSQ